MTLPPVLATTWVVIEYLIKIAALGTVPENRRPSSSTAWLLLIFLLPLVGLPLYLLIGSPWVHGTRRRQQHTVNEITLDYTRSMPDLPKGARPSTYLAGALRMNRRLTGLPCVSGEVVAVHADPRSTYEAMARAIDSATDHVHVEFYIMSWDEVTDVFFAIPLLLAAIVFMQMFKGSRSIFMVVIVLAMFGWTSIARITRGSVLSAKNEEFVTAARATGASRARILMSHIIPNSMAPIIVYATVALGTFIVSEASLSFMGIGLPTSVVSWGADISSAQTSLRTNPMVLFYPASALAMTVLSFIMMGDAVREALDPKARK